MRHIILILLFFVTGCSLQQQNSNKLANQLEQQNPEQILTVLQEITPDESDFVQYQLNLGYLQLLNGQFDLAIQSLTDAKDEMQVLSATSISENVGASTVNETFRSYSGYPTDRVMVHNMLAFSYLFNNDIEGARIEMLQANVAMKKLAENGTLSGQLASTHIFSAIIYELLDERSNSFISYQHAEKILTKRKVSIPDGIKLSLLRMSKKMGNDKSFKLYSKKYKNLVKYVNTGKQVFNIYFDGVVSNKEEKSIGVVGNNLMKIAMPTYPTSNYRLRKNSINDGTLNMHSDLIENINSLVREDLKAEYPSILLATTTRAITKNVAVNVAKRADPLFGALINLFTVVSEVADVRSWNMLPATIQFNYLETTADNVVISNSVKSHSTVILNEGKQHVFLTSSLSDRIFHYQQ